MHMTRQIFLLVFAFTTCSSVTFGKAAGDLLRQYVENPKEAVKEEVLALVEIASIDTDAKPEKNWRQTGTLHLKLIEAVDGDIPKEFTVRFFKRDAEGEDEWTWDYVTLTPGKRLLGFFNHWEGKWAVREDGRTNVINNPEYIAEDLIKHVQPMFQTLLQSEADGRMKNNVPEDTPSLPAFFRWTVAGSLIAISALVTLCGMLRSAAKLRERRTAHQVATPAPSLSPPFASGSRGAGAGLRRSRGRGRRQGAAGL